MIRVLVVDDSALVRKLLGQVFAGQPDFEVEIARDGLEALEKIATFDPNVVTLDFHMPGMDGLACLDRIMLEHPRPVVMVSSLTAEGAEVTLEALRLGAVDFVAKPGGAVSLRIDELAAELLAKVRSAAGARLRLASRLRERVRHRIAAATPPASTARSPAPVDEPDLGDDEPAFADAVPADGVVLVGVSTGGPPALEALLTPLPADFPWPIVIAQHMPRSFTGALARRLDGICALKVVEVARPTPLEPGCAYIGRGDADLILSRRADRLVAMAAPARADYPWHPSTDRLVRTAMEQLAPERLIGVLMTGMGNDGAEAMTELHTSGGRTIAEAEETAVVWGMPGELVRLGGAQFTLPLPRIAERLRRMVR